MDPDRPSALYALHRPRLQWSAHLATTELQDLRAGPEVTEVVPDLRRFVADAAEGWFTDDEAADEAGVWLELLGAARVHAPALAGFLALVIKGAGATPAEPPAEPPPATPLEAAVRAAAGDERARPALWHALHSASIHLPVLHHDLILPGGKARFQLLALRLGGSAVVLGFTAEHHLEDLEPAAGRVEATGLELVGLWPDEHWLVLDAGTSHAVLLSPAEVMGLPHGPAQLMPPPDAISLVPGDPADRRWPPVVAALRAAGVKRAAWATIRARGPGEPREVVAVVAEDSPAAAAVVLRALAGPVHLGWAVLPADPAETHPLTEAVLTRGTQWP